MKRRTISTAYDAYWFLHDHPAMRCNECLRVASNLDKEDYSSDPHRHLREIADSVDWVDATYTVVECTHLYRRAIEDNLDIHYAKVDSAGVVNDDKSLNVNVECWLEFGPIEYSIFDGGPLHLEHIHDIRLDCGGPTFDEALVKLANLVLKHYGDFKA